MRFRHWANLALALFFLSLVASSTLAYKGQIIIPDEDRWNMDYSGGDTDDDGGDPDGVGLEDPEQLKPPESIVHPDTPPDALPPGLRPGTEQILWIISATLRDVLH